MRYIELTLDDADSPGCLISPPESSKMIYLCGNISCLSLVSCATDCPEVLKVIVLKSVSPFSEQNHH